MNLKVVAYVVVAAVRRGEGQACSCSLVPGAEREGSEPR